MAGTPSEFELLIDRMRAGSEDAAQEIFDKYSDHILRIVRRRLHPRLRGQYDSVDFLQSVWASFFHTPTLNRQFHSPEELISFLARIAYTKVVMAYRRRLGTDKHGRHEELSLEILHSHEGQESPVSKTAPRQPTPSQVAIAKESWEQILKGQPPHYRTALEMLRQGHSQREVADRLGMNPKSIQRLLRSLSLQGDLP
jgi:RNA polymerase sigma-70 factor (ECF subfamily)